MTTARSNGVPRPSEWDRFKSVAERLVSVPKHALDKAMALDKVNRQPSRRDSVADVVLRERATASLERIDSGQLRDDLPRLPELREEYRRRLSARVGDSVQRGG